jgi:hypothetical protein
MNTILEEIINRRKGNYCHALELKNLYELEFVIDELYREFETNYSQAQIIDFFSTMEIYYLPEEGEENPEEENALYNFDFEEYIKNL